MRTPIVDFLKKYEQSKILRFHMPGHKGKSFLGCEGLDITEVKGADSLYEADGIIAESEENVTKLFGTARTLYSTEGSSQCIRAMLFLAISNYWRQKRFRPSTFWQNVPLPLKQEKRPIILAARNVHKAFLYAAALVDADVEWLWSESKDESLCKCEISKEQLEKRLKELEKDKKKPAAVYVTSPNYLGEQLDIKGLSQVAHRYDALFLVDNAHGAYLHFLEKSAHPMDLGADLCCDSAHKTLPVLTGGAYLHIAKTMPNEIAKESKQAMSLFGSTSPSYLTMASLDLCNSYLEKDYRKNLKEKIKEMEQLKEKLKKQGWQVEKTDPLKLTIKIPDKSGRKISELLREKKIECEYAEDRYIVFMLTVENAKEELVYLEKSLKEIQMTKKKEMENFKQFAKEDVSVLNIAKEDVKQVFSIRQAIFSPHETIPVCEALGRICATPTVTCPPAIPIAVAGEKIGERAIALFQYYGITEVDVIQEDKN